MTLPKTFLKLFREKRFPEILYFVRALWDREGWLYLKRNKNAVARVKVVFTQLTGKQPYSRSGDNSHWDKQIAKYCDALGVAALLDDIKLNGKKPNSLLYFLYSSTGACRWENLLMAKIGRAHEREKQKHLQELDELAEMIDFEMKAAAPPEWVLQARINYTELKKRRSRMNTRGQRLDADREIERIEYNLKKFGYSIPDDPGLTPPSD